VRDAPPARCPLVIVVMGVTGAGKTTVGQALAASLGRAFADADDFHPPANVAKMRGGTALGDDDRAPWLAALGAWVAQRVRDEAPAVLACSALRERHRAMLVPDGAGPLVRLVHLEVAPDAVRERLESRHGHFMPPSLVDSQFATLEPPAAAVRVDGTLPVETIVQRVRESLGC
jgi:gluconokinase